MSFPFSLSGIYCIVLRIATIFMHPNVKWFFFSWERVWAWPSKITRGSIRHCWQSNIGLLSLKCCLSSAISVKTVAFHLLKFCCHCWMLLIVCSLVVSFLFRRASQSSNRWHSKEAEVDCWCAKTVYCSEAVVLVSLYSCPYVSIPFLFLPYTECKLLRTKITFLCTAPYRVDFCFVRRVSKYHGV